ncbi:MAG: hypothetical protein B7Z75_06545 [Acidocella sp. 20-57-95]|nr:MAG: hypothetical protein B7Z75_06545 [Acidocella sp. 20-57-95]HQT64800.1 hypothetical protein [Acidocella sp.]HQU05576.1 hypothetical protein [Acidocella sp.]
MTLILSNEDVSRLLTMPDCITGLEIAYRELAEGRGVSRTRSDTYAPTSRDDALYCLKSMDGIAPHLGVGAVRINSDILTWPQDGGSTRRVKAPAAPNARYVGLVLLFSTETGEPLAIFPDGVVQRLRVGAANGLAVKYLARADAKVAGLLGTGWQAGAQAMAAVAVRDIEVLRCYSPNQARREAFATEMTTQLGIEVQPVKTPEAAVDGADIVMCATNTIDPVFFAQWMAPGMHVSAVTRRELGRDVIDRADRVFLHTPAETPINTLSAGVVLPELEKGKGWRVTQAVDFAKLPLLTDLIAGRATGRATQDEITCFINNLGLGYQFAVTGALLYAKAKATGAGRDLPTDWFTETEHP